MRNPRRPVAIHKAHPKLRLLGKEIEAAIALLDANSTKFRGGCPAGELSIAFLTDIALARIHGDFMDDPTATDVITFGGNPATGQAGEICVSADTAAKYVLSLSRGKPGSAFQQRFSSELTLYIVHGWLHLAGYDDLEPSKKRLMRAAERRAVTVLRAGKAMPSFKFDTRAS